MISPWSVNNPSLTTIAASALIWLILVHWIGSAVGGFLAGRLRRGWDDLHRAFGITERFYDWFIPVISERDFALRRDPLDRALDFVAVLR